MGHPDSFQCPSRETFLRGPSWRGPLGIEPRTRPTSAMEAPESKPWVNPITCGQFFGETISLTVKNGHPPAQSISDRGDLWTVCFPKDHIRKFEYGHLGTVFFTVTIFKI